MFKFNSNLFKFHQDQFYFKLKKIYCDLHETFFKIIDKPPQRKKNELTTDYVLRLNKRHALRELHRTLIITWVFKLDSVNAKLNTDIPESTRTLFEFMKSQTEHYYLCKYLSEQIKNS